MCHYSTQAVVGNVFLLFQHNQHHGERWPWLPSHTTSYVKKKFDKFEYRSRCDIGARRLSWSLFVKFFIDPVTIFFNIKCKVETILLWRYNNLVSMSENFRRKLLILRPIKNFSRWCQFYKTLHFNFSVFSFMLLSRFLLLSNRLKMYT